MTSYQDFNLVNNEIEFLRVDKKLESSDLAFIYYYLQNHIVDVDSEELITDGPRDLGIDAYYINNDDKVINIYQFKYTSKFESSQKQTMPTVEISKLYTTLKAIYAKNEEYLSQGNYAVKAAIKDIYSVFESTKEPYEIHLIFVSNYSTTLHPGEQKKFSRMFKEMDIIVDYVCLEDIVRNSLKSRRPKIDVKIKIIGENFFDVASGSIRAVIAQACAYDLLESIASIDNELDENLFDENVRIYLQMKSKINYEIQRTATGDQRHKFFYYNNGVTIICDAIDYTPYSDPWVTLRNFQIVNGGQTIHTLFDVYKSEDKEKLKDIYLLIKIYEVKDRLVGQEVARYTNSQNPVKGRDILSNDPIQIKIEKELLGKGFYYERKKNQYRLPDVKNELRIDSEKAGQAILAYHVEKPGESKNKRQEVFGDYYGVVFDESRLAAEYVLVPHLLLNLVNKEISKVRSILKQLEGSKTYKKYLLRNEFILHANFYLIMTMKLLAARVGDTITLENFTRKYKKYFPVANELLYKISTAKLKNPKLSLPKIFKSDDLVTDIKEVVRKGSV